MLAVYIKCHLRYWVSKNDPVPCSGEAFMEDRVQLIMTVKIGNGTKCKLSCDTGNGYTTSAICTTMEFFCQ